MKQPKSSFRPGHFTQLVSHLHEFGDSRRQQIAELYGAPDAEPASLAEYWLRNPDRVVEVVRQQLDSSVEWRIVEEAVMEHDLGVVLDWAPARGRRQVARLGLMEPKLDHTGHYQGMMPGALAAIFADRVRGQRGSLPVLLGRCDDEEVRQLARRWDLDDEGTKVEVILRICDHFGREEMIDEMLEELPNPNWIGDALMILELGGICHWQAIYGYDLDNGSGRPDNVVPLMRDHERRQQQKIAERLLQMGALFRFEDEGGVGALAAVPEALWPGLWRLGRRWLMDWNREAVGWLRERTATQQPSTIDEPHLQHTLKWWLCESRSGQLGWVKQGDETALSDVSVERLNRVYDGPGTGGWQSMWKLGRQMRILDACADGGVDAGREAQGLLDESSDEFVGEVLLEWCLGYTGRDADEGIAEAIGLDETWRGRATSLMKQHGEPVPAWMSQTGVESNSTGAGWLRHIGTGDEEMVLFESGLVVTFVLMTKVLWLDLVSVLGERRRYPIDGLVGLMQNVAGLAMFGQLRLVLEEQPAPVYLPFQRASILMDNRQMVPFSEWVENIIDELLVPLGVAQRQEDGIVVLDTSRLRVDDPPGWPSGQRKKLIAEIFEQNVDFELSESNGSVLREVAGGANGEETVVSVEEPLARLLEIAEQREVTRFDGRFIEFQ